MMIKIRIIIIILDLKKKRLINVKISKKKKYQYKIVIKNINYYLLASLRYTPVREILYTFNKMMNHCKVWNRSWLSNLKLIEKMNFQKNQGKNQSQIEIKEIKFLSKNNCKMRNVIQKCIIYAKFKVFRQIQDISTLI